VTFLSAQINEFVFFRCKMIAVCDEEMVSFHCSY